MVLNSHPNASLYLLNFQMICPNNIFAPSPSLFLCAPASYCSLSHPQTPTSSEFLSLCHSEDWIIHACCQRWIMWAEQARAHLTAMQPRSYRSHHIDAVSWSRYVAFTGCTTTTQELLSNPGLASALLAVFFTGFDLTIKGLTERDANPNKNLSSLVKLVELNGDLSQRLASSHPTLNWWQNINRFSRLCSHKRVACGEHHVVNCTSREASAHWSVDGSLNNNYSYGGTFKAVTPCYQTERAQTMLTAGTQREITILKISGFDTLARQPSWGVLVVISSHPPPSPFFLFPGYSVLEAWRSIHLHHLHHPLDQETPLCSHGVQLPIRTHTYGEQFEYFVYVMTKGEELSPEDAALEELLQADQPLTAQNITL